MNRTKQLSQYMTPAWAARELFAAHFSDVTAQDVGFEPTCGDGRCLQAIPDHVPAFGCEQDAEKAGKARARTGREVFVGNVLTMQIPRPFTFVFGNPPFKTDFMDRFLSKIEALVVDGCRCGLILPAYFLQTPSTVKRWNRMWTIFPEMLPRTLFPGLELPLVFTIFTKDPAPVLKGMRLYSEAHSIEDLREEFRKEMTSGRGLWMPIVAAALERLGGRAHLAEIYEVIGKNRPTRNEWWRQKIRQTLQRHACFSRRGSGVWSLELKAA